MMAEPRERCEMVTMSDVAKEAQVSRATASYALRGDRRIADDTRRRVLLAAHKLRYSANLSARSLRSGKSGIIGVAIFELDKPYPAQMSAAISRQINAHGMQAIIQQTSNSKQDEVSILRHVTSQLCDGTIFSPGSITNEEMQELADGKPLVLLDDPSAEPVFDSVMTAGFEGATMAVQHLLDCGCRRIGVVGADMAASTDPVQRHSVHGRRVAGCLKTLKAAGIKARREDFLPLERWDGEMARDLGHHLTDTSDLPFDGIFCMTDSLALGLIRGLHECGVEVPRDLAVVGFDGIQEGESYIPSLTTISTDKEDLARKAVDALLARLQGEDDDRPPTRTTAACRLVVRESTARIR